MNKRITGTGNLRAMSLALPGAGGSVETPQSFFVGARDFLTAFETLATENAPAAPVGFLASHCLELMLKAHLLAKGTTEKQLKEIGHDLKCLWSLCAKGLSLDKNVPRWVCYLDAGHSRPYRFRYTKSNTGIVLPSKLTLLANLRETLRAVKVTISKRTAST